ncbi:hypothetical protein RHMOL_Rhmol01G0047800 [Rhododendron molle]|uniref:Uncharacterized protein n=1 Tax=Rhododendron molle TaxID=49168 RepID=A0ACC0Q125_RHOML|nr:hypothetical protein RHMOL_Rhmol01G0047800 [Rhododendron molle]
MKEWRISRNVELIRREVKERLRLDEMLMDFLFKLDSARVRASRPFSGEHRFCSMIGSVHIVDLIETHNHAKNHPSHRVLHPLCNVFLIRLLWIVVVVILAVENGCNGCWEKERIALLQLKDSINFPNGNSLPSWEDDDHSDCCKWEAVECNSTTRRVIKLELNNTRDWGLDGRWHLNASILLPLESLRSIDLSQNQLQSSVGNEGMVFGLFYAMKRNLTTL